MNTKIKLALLAGKYNEKGFTTGLAIGLGLISMAVGFTMVARGQLSQNTAAAQKSTTQVGGIAEAGATRYLSFLNQNPQLLTADDQTEWTTISNDTPVITDELCPNYTTNSTVDVQTIENFANTSDWKTAGNGSYRLVSYEYKGSNQGVLTIQGKLNDKPAKTQLKYDIKLADGEEDTFLDFYGLDGVGLWSKQFNTKSQVHGNVLDSSGCQTGNGSFNKSLLDDLPVLPIASVPNGNQTPPLTSTKGSMVKDLNGMPFPPLPHYPSSSEFTTLVSQGKVNQLSACTAFKTVTKTVGKKTVTETVIDTANTKYNYPANGDKDADGNTYNASSPPSTGKVYKYRITGDCNLPADVTFGTNTGKDRIIMYVDGKLDISNNAKLGSLATNKAKVAWLLNQSEAFELGGNAQIGSAVSASAANWSFFLQNATSVELKGTADIYAFIFAPKASTTMKGNPKIAGGLWVNSYSTNGAPPKVLQAVTGQDLKDLFTYLYTDTGTPIPSSTNKQISNVSGFTKEPVTP